MKKEEHFDFGMRIADKKRDFIHRRDAEDAKKKLGTLPYFQTSNFE
jgi:hypothetical protein